ncbi:ketol-acid reductoisomerase [Formicincola oecophyllae]|uniref:Ketol-acid reductoisomerase (NADP(+)) n=1 Tax=Formicincola oecophyllae TaxID=2558361 RepID=A0A4Y6UBS6_9PROT|nr:ketol-acid reductoisomerase [Formicincola oecophyllae]
MDVRYDRDCDVGLIQGRRVAVVGYGNQGRAHAANLRDSGVRDLVVAARPQSPARQQAAEAGFTVMTPEEAAAWADVLFILTPDEGHGALYKTLEPHLRKGAALGFAHGLSVHAGLVRPRADLDVFLLAPKGAGWAVRAEYQKGSGVLGLAGVAQDASGQAWELAYAYGAALGCGRAGMLATSFGEEMETDLFGEQAVLCGGMMELVKAGFETLVERGYAPEIAYLECVHELKLVVDLLYKGGLGHVSRSISNTAEYGAISKGPKVVGANVKKRMGEVLDAIQDGTFVRDFMVENQSGGIKMNAARRRDEHSLQEHTGAALRSVLARQTKQGTQPLPPSQALIVLQPEGAGTESKGSKKERGKASKAGTKAHKSKKKAKS